MKKMVTILNFSPREGGNCGEIGRYIHGFYENSNIRSFLISSVFTPCGGCGYQCLKPGERCPSLTEAQSQVFDAVCQSDAVYFILPNFCGFPNAVYYAFNERSVGYFNMDRDLMERYMNVRKRFIIVSNSESSAFTEAMQQQTKDEPEILYMKTSRYGKKSIAGDMLASSQARADLEAFLAMETL